MTPALPAQPREKMGPLQSALAHHVTVGPLSCAVVPCRTQDTGFGPVPNLQGSQRSPGAPGWGRAPQGPAWLGFHIILGSQGCGLGRQGHQLSPGGAGPQPVWQGKLPQNHPQASWICRSCWPPTRRANRVQKPQVPGRGAPLPQQWHGTELDPVWAQGRGWQGLAGGPGTPAGHRWRRQRWQWAVGWAGGGRPVSW